MHYIAVTSEVAPNTSICIVKDGVVKDFLLGFESTLVTADAEESSKLLGEVVIRL